MEDVEVQSPNRTVKILRTHEEVMTYLKCRDRKIVIIEKGKNSIDEEVYRVILSAD